MDAFGGSDSTIRTLSSLGPRLLWWFHSHLGFPHMVAHSIWNPISHHTMVEKEHFFSSVSSKHPRTDSHWTAWGHMPISEPTPGAGHKRAGVLADESLAYSWSLRVGVSPTRITERVREGKFSWENLECSFQKEEELLGRPHYKHLLQSYGDFEQGRTTSPASQFLFHCAPQLPQLFLLPRNSLFRNHKT